VPDSASEEPRSRAATFDKSDVQEESKINPEEDIESIPLVKTQSLVSNVGDYFEIQNMNYSGRDRFISDDLVLE
jgi:hypothetical protein